MTGPDDVVASCPGCHEAVQPDPGGAWSQSGVVLSLGCPQHHRAVHLLDHGVPALRIRLHEDSTATVRGWVDAVHNRPPVLHRVNRAAAIALAGEPERAAAASLDLTTAVVGQVYGLTPAQTRAFIDAGIESVHDMRGWANCEFTAEKAKAWVAAGVDNGGDARMWRSLDVDPIDAHGFSSPAAWLFIERAALPAAPQWGNLFDVVGPTFAKEGHDQRQDPQAVRALGQALGRHVFATEKHMAGTRHERGLVVLYSPWDTTRETRITAMARRLRGHDWNDALACLSVGMGVEEAFAHVTGGADMEPVRLVAALSA